MKHQQSACPAFHVCGHNMPCSIDYVLHILHTMFAIFTTVRNVMYLHPCASLEQQRRGSSGSPYGTARQCWNPSAVPSKLAIAVSLCLHCLPLRPRALPFACLHSHVLQSQITCQDENLSAADSKLVVCGPTQCPLALLCEPS